MYLIDKTYFIKELNVPNTEEHNADASIQLDMSIDRYARQLLQTVLGATLFAELDSNITNGELELLAPQKWLDLVNGVTYTLDGKSYVWQGLKFEQGLYKVSILADYVYLNHYSQDVNTMLGQVMLDAKNSVNVSDVPHLTDIWNGFILKYQGTSNSQPKQYFHNGVLFTDYYGFDNNGYVSLLQFLTDNKGVYEGFTAPELAFKNQFGI